MTGLDRVDLVLASTSRYRRELLTRIAPRFRVVAPQVDETPQANEAPAALAIRLADAKACAVAALCPGALVIGSDQVADLDGKILEKPGNVETARSQLAASSGRQVIFHTAICLLDAVSVGPACVDKYEASLWKTTHPTVILKIKLGMVRLADLQEAGAVQLGLADGDLVATGCPLRAGACQHVYAVSIRGALPARFVNWFQALAALRNSGKRLPTNQEWQAAALGTPDYLFDTSVPECNTNTDGVEPTGSRAGCRSDVGAYDMVGNVREMVAEWVPKATGCAPTRPKSRSRAW